MSKDTTLNDLLYTYTEQRLMRVRPMLNSKTVHQLNDEKGAKVCKKLGKNLKPRGKAYDRLIALERASIENANASHHQ